MALTRRNQVLELIRQGATGSVPITLPAELQTEWVALVDKYKAQTDAKREQWRLAVATAKADDLAAGFAGASPRLIAKVHAAILEPEVPV